MHTHNVLYRGLTVVLLVMLFLLAVTLPGTAAPRIHPAADSNAGWQEVGADSASGGGISDNNGHSYHSSLAIAPDGTPYVAWWDESGENREIYVRSWNGSTWEEVGIGSASGGGISDNSGYSYDPSVAIAPDGTPYVAWHDRSGGDREIYVRRWKGSDWEEVGAGSASGGGISDNNGESWSSAVAVAPDGTPYVAWRDDSGGDWEIYVRRWNGSSWEEVGAGSASDGGISDNSGYSYHPSMAVAPDGTPYVAWADDSGGGYEIYVRRWDGSNWEEVGAGSASGGGISDNSGDSVHPSVDVAPDGTPCIAWHDSSGGDYEIYARRWDGSSWEEVGAGSASGGGISNNSGVSFFPSVAIALDGQPYVAWLDDSDGWYPEIYVRRWDGSNWEEVGVGSASGGGISDNSGYSYDPSVAVAPDGTPYIAWEDCSGGNWEIYLRRWYAPLAPISTLIPPSGGDLTSNDTNQSTTIQFPAGAVMTDTVITYTYQIPLPMGSLVGIDHFFELLAAQNGTPVSSFSKPVTIAVRYTYQERGPVIADSLNLYWLSGTNWITEGITTIGRSDHVITSTTDHFTLFAVLGETNRVYLPIGMKGYCTDNYEPNDWCEQAYGPLTSGQNYQSWISCCDVTTYKKSDYFYIDISTTNAINIYLTEIPAGTNSDLYLYRNPGDDPNNPAAKSEGTGSSETISYNPPSTGTYYIRVYGRTGYSASPYSLRVTYD